MAGLDSIPYYDGAVIAGSLTYHQPSCHVINQISRGHLKRFKSWQSAADNGFSPCGLCRPGRYPPAPLIQLPVEDSEEEQRKPVTPAELAEMRRRIVQLLIKRDVGNASVEGGSPTSRINRMARDGRLPRVVGPMMRLILEMRNASEYESKELTQVESDAVEAVWSAIEEWAAAENVEL